MNLAETVSRLREHWTMIFPDAPMPDNKQWALWLLAHDEAQVRQALSVLAIRASDGKRQIENEDLHRFVMGILIRNQQHQGRGSHMNAKVAPLIVTAEPDDDNVGNRA